MVRTAVLGILVLIFIGVLLRNTNVATSGVKPHTDIRSARHPLNVSISKMTWRKGGFDTVMIVTLTIENKEDFGVKDIDIVCELTARSGTPIGITASTIYDVVSPHGRLTVRDLNMGSGVTIDFNQADRAFCKLGAMSRA